MIPKHKRFVLNVFLGLRKYSRKQDSVDLESEVMRGPGSMPTGGKICHCFFWFSCSKDENANIWHFRVVCEKIEC